MKISIGQRVKELLHEYKFKQIDLLRLLKWDIDKTKGTISLWLRSEEDTQYGEFLQGVVKMLPEVNASWIITGEGEKLLNQSQFNNQQRPSGALESNQTTKNEKAMNERQLNRVIDILENELNEKNATIKRLLNLLDEGGKKKEVG